MSSDSTGYGLNICRKLHFDGNDEKFELWEAQFLAYLRLKKLHTVLEEQDGDDAATVDANKNALVYAELMQCLDEKSMLLIFRDAKDDGVKAIKILREHYLGTSEPRILALYSELASLKMNSSDTVTDYLLRAEKAASRLSATGEPVSDRLLISMILRGLPESFQAFSTITTQKDKKELTLQKFKASIRSYEENEKARINHTASSGEDNISQFKSGNIVCFQCGKPGHRKFQCQNGKADNSSNSQRFHHKSKRWCNHCKSSTHDTNYCRKKTSSAKSVQDNCDQSEETGSYNFLVSDDFDCGIADDSVSQINSSFLLVDSGATSHIISDQSKFVNLDKNFDPEKHFIELADGSRKNNIVSAKGDARIMINDSKGVLRKIILKDALCIPSYKQNILSVQSVTKYGGKVNFQKGSAKLMTSDRNIFNIVQQGKLYFLNSARSYSTRTLEEWHKALGHCNVKDVLSLESKVNGMNIVGKDKFNCGTCAEGKMTQYRSYDADKKATKPLEFVHSDLAGPINPVSHDNSRYAISFVDDFSGLSVVYFLKSKSDAAGATAKFLADMSPYGTVKTLRTDNGTEYTCNEFKSLMIKNKINHEFSAPYSPHQNGTAERSWRSLFDMARCSLLQANLPQKLWNYAVRNASYVRNRCINKRTGKTPYEMFKSVKPDISNLHIFGSTCFGYVQNKKKLDPRSEEGLFVGHDPSSPAYLVYFPAKDEIKRVRCVTFHDTIPTQRRADGDEPGHYPCLGNIAPNAAQQPALPQVPAVPQVPAAPTPEPAPQVVVQPAEEAADPHPTPAATGQQDDNDRRYPARQRNKPGHLKDYVDPDDDPDVANCTIDHFYRVSDSPKTYREAISSPDADQWQAAMETEMSSLVENDTFELVSRPTDREIIGGRWVYNLKLGRNNEQTHKARYVAKGYAQVEGIDFKETFSPTARMSSVRALVDIAVQDNCVVHQMDVKSAYLNAPIDQVVYVEQPSGFVQGKNQVYKLKKSLYGLKQSGRMWNSVLHSFLLSQNFVQSMCDNCVYTKHNNNLKTIIIVWVDDIIISGSNLNCVNQIKLALSNKFKMKDLGPISWFLGIEFVTKDESIEMNQSKFIDKILSRFNMSDCHPKSLPCDLGIDKINDDVKSQELADPKLYREIVGSLIYLMTCTRPDICYVVTKLSQHLSNPTKAHLSLSKFVLKYLKGTIGQGLKFIKSKDPINLVGYCDSDWAGSSDRKSITGYCFQLSHGGSLISWRSKKQQIVALSSCEAEYVSLTHCIQEGNFLRQLISDLKGSDKLPVNLYVDNKGAIDLARNPVHHQRSKHIDVKYHFIRLQVQNSSVILHYVPSAENVADIFTKPVTKIKLQKFRVCN